MFEVSGGGQGTSHTAGPEHHSPGGTIHTIHLG